jgi:hypothetical protein
MFRIYDQFIPPSYQNNIAREMFGREFPWHFIGSTLVGEKDLAYRDTDMGPADSGLDTPQMYHTFYNMTFDPDRQPSSHYYMIKPMLYFIEQQANITITQVHRIKANMLNPVEGLAGYHIPHIDYRDPNYMSLIYYVNDSDGDTVFFDQIGDGITRHPNFTLQHRQTPRKGSAVLFDSHQFHASSMPVTTPARIVINFIFRYVPNI